MSEFEWSAGSALYQVEHGEPGSERTSSAVLYLTRALDAGPEQAARMIGLNLLTAVERMAAGQ